LFDTTLFKKELSTSWLGRELFFFDRLDSTNTYAKNIERDGSRHGALILTDDQFEGRGQYDRTWKSDPSLNLTFSLIFAPSKGERLTVLTLSAALAIAETIEESTKEAVTIKWPNDVLIKGQKVAGLLTETLFNGNTFERAIVGIGINVDQDKFDENIHGKATSIKKISNQDSSRERLLARLLSRIEYYYRLWETMDIELIKQVNKKLIGYGKWTNLIVNDELLDGEFKFLGINEAGQMVVLNKELEVNTFSYEQVRVQFDPKTS
jgi:BirA family biotin operon repressor/biotin-[acetyl-CoA-carboxylase] ligase